MKTENNMPTGMARAVDTVIVSRRSVRQFLKKEVPHEIINEILDMASWAPSGHNTQSWKVYVATGKYLEALSDGIYPIFDDEEALADHVAEFNAYPVEWVSPFIDRRRALGRDMYGLLGIARGERERMMAQAGKNYQFFDAPVGFIFTIDRIMLPGAALDMGMFMQTLMLTAKSRGLDTCAQQAFAPFHKIIRNVLNIPENEVVICGMSLGYADPNALINSLKLNRLPVSAFTKFFGYD